MEENRKYCVYKHTNKINGKVYIGQTCLKPERRWGKQGERYIECPYFYSAIQKYGWDNFEHEVLFKNLTKEEADKIEIYLIEILNARNPEFGYNLKEGGHTPKHSDITRKKMSESHKGERNYFYGKHHTEETKQKISNSKKGIKSSAKTVEKMKIAFSGANNPMYGKHHTEDAKQKMSEYRKGKTMPEETRQKISNSIKGKLNPMYGKRGPETGMYGKHHSEKARIKMSKPVKCIETDTIYYGATEAGRILHIEPSSITKCCRGKLKTAGGFHWKYA